MVEVRDRWSRLELVTEYLLAPLPVFDHAGEPFRVSSLQPSPAVDGLRAAGALANVPSSLRHFARLTAPGAPLALDAAIVQVSPPGPEGRFSLGVSVATPVEMLANAPLVIAAVNPRMPYTFGAAELDRDEIDLLVDVDHPLVELAAGGETDETTSAIGRHVAERIPDGAVLQFGVGAIPGAVLGELGGRRDLAIHGGMLGDTVVGLHASGALTGARKPIWPGRMTVGAVLGSAPSFDFVDRNPEVLMVPASISHGVGWLSRLEGFAAVNSAVEVALDGAINAETAGDRVLSGPGGQPDFLIGAAEAPGGRSFIAMPSTAGGGKRSRIVPRLEAGATVTVARSLTDWVVTEFGAVRLTGLSLAQRAEALRSIAHPDHRAALAGG
jgi:acyl-CoA hydrolase